MLFVIRIRRDGVLSVAIEQPASDVVENDQTEAPRFLAPGARAALVVAHPAHELRVYEWLSRARPSVHILTSGSRSGDGKDRLTASAEVISSANGALINPEAAMLDRDLYRAVMVGNPDPFHAWTDQLAQSLIARKTQVMVVDAWQYYNAAHDLTHVMGRIAAAKAGLALGSTIDVLDYAVVHGGLAPHAPESECAFELCLTEEQTDRKMAIARSFPDIQTELDELIDGEGQDGLSKERFTRPPALRALLKQPAEKPVYERYGEARVASGLYKDVLRWTHVFFILQSLTARHPALFASLAFSALMGV
jgi:hypothetical protein